MAWRMLKKEKQIWDQAGNIMKNTPPTPTSQGYDNAGNVIWSSKTMVPASSRVDQQVIYSMLGGTGQLADESAYNTMGGYNGNGPWEEAQRYWNSRVQLPQSP